MQCMKRQGNIYKIQACNLPSPCLIFYTLQKKTEISTDIMYPLSKNEENDQR